jgi:acyl carrier protein
MSQIDAVEVRTVLVKVLNSQPCAQAIDPKMLTDDYDILRNGLIDSLGLLNLIAALKEQFGDHLDFETLDPEQMTIVGPLCGFVVEQAAKV